MALYDYRLFRNINMGSKNRYGIIHKSHYSCHGRRQEQDTETTWRHEGAIDRRKYRDTVAHNIVASRSIRLAAQSKRRYNLSTAAKKYRRLEPTVDTLNRTITPSSDCLEQTTSTTINIAPGPPILIIISNEVHPSNIFGIGNNATMQIMDVESNHASINSSNNITESACSKSPIKKSIKRAPRKCQLCQNTSPTCKGSSKSVYCKFKCGVCANSDCPARFENTKECLRK
ncbi:hypothetical protein INT47_007395 [Mucor saturninus]|uniref:Uncharacterized protein n=1 Tax=Mucor saturninus TaxID=64648 RepID=A0A8H7QJ24_9FUNG|nr:hypothetical protein INT47_007395 [Mucor saturninus]